MVLKTDTVHADYYSMFTMTHTKGYVLSSTQSKGRSNMIRCLGLVLQYMTAIEHLLLQTVSKILRLNMLNSCQGKNRNVTFSWRPTVQMSEEQSSLRRTLNLFSSEVTAAWPALPACTFAPVKCFCLTVCVMSVLISGLFSARPPTQQLYKDKRERDSFSNRHTLLHLRA